jgi:hypothetical protein
MVQGAKAALEAVKTGQRKLAENVAEFLLDEKPVLVRPQWWKTFPPTWCACAMTSNALPSGWPNWNRNWDRADAEIFAPAENPAGCDSYGLDEIAIRA